MAGSALRGNNPGMARVSLLTAFLAAAVGVAGCSPSSAGGSTGKGIPATAATALATRADGVAAALDIGDCEQALAQARSLQTDVAAVKVAPAVATEAAAGAARLVDAIHCAPAPPPAPTPTVVQVPPPTGGGAPWHGKGKGHGGGHEGDD
jgi:hypothetical protein